MPRLAALFLCLGLSALLAGCQPAGTGTGDPGTGDLTPNAVTGDAIEVTALDAPPAEAEAAPGPQAEAEKPPQSDPPEAVTEDPALAEIEPAPQPDLEETPVEEQKSDKQIACEKKKGRWLKVSASSHTCVFTTKDSGKSCTKGTECEGDCLARSGTCSPLRPLLGCNEILQDDGRRVTLCID